MSSKAGRNISKNVVSKDRLLHITDASEYLHTSRNTMWRIIKQYKIKTFENPLDLRETLVCIDDLDHIKTILRPKKRRQRAKGK